jgi:hypothetical protein
MPRRFRKKHHAFITLPRHKRSDEVIRLKGRIKRTSAEYGGMFTSHLVLDEPGRPDLYNQWFDFYFPGQDRFTLWNATIVTARMAFWDAVNDLAYQRTTDMLTPEELAAEPTMEFEPAEFSKTGKVLTYKLVERDKPKYEKFGGLTFFEQWEKQESEVARAAPPTIYESFRLDRNYAYGIGLSIVLDVGVIDRAAIEQAIIRFREIGEIDWQADYPVPREKLPFVSEKEALAAIQA